MKPAIVIRKIFKAFGFVVLALVLLVVGTVVALYSPWLQEELRAKIVERMNLRPGVEMTLDSFRFGFPLKLSLGGLSLVQQGDTIIAASELSTSVGLLPLLKGEAKVSEVSLSDARFVMGSPDSAMYMTIAARSLDLRPVTVGLKDMAIDIESGDISDATVSMVISPDTSTVSAPPALDLLAVLLRIDLAVP